MAMMRSGPFNNMLPLRDAMNQLVHESFVVPFDRLGATTSIMPVDVYETDDAFVVKAFMPGITPDDLQISVEQQSVTIHGQPHAQDMNGMRPLLQERPLSAFTRRFTLPRQVDAGKVNAELSSGVLTLWLPKSESSKPRKIQIQQG